MLRTRNPLCCRESADYNNALWARGGVAPATLQSPIRVAERIGALDILSRGRLDVGFARSTTLTEMGAFGIDPNNTRP